MPKSSSGYVFDSANECDRLERQAALLDPERLLRAVRPPSGARILDAGCGSGAVSRIIAKRHPDAEVVGVDVNPAYVSYAARRAKEEGLDNLSFQPGDVQALLFPDTSFDLVWTQFVLYFLPRPEAALAEFRRLLRPGGQVVIALHENTYLAHAPENPSLQDRLERVIPGLLDVRLARRLPLMLRAAGFADVAAEVELDPVYTAIGRISDGSRRNVSEILASAIPRISELLGGQSQAEAYRADLLAWLDHPDTCSYSFLWTVSGVASRL
jgi:SAM-dependent methyltransferase